MRDLSGRTALVTGGASGIGAAISRDLADAGAAVIVLDLDASGAARVADELPEGRGSALGEVDLDDPVAIDRALQDLTNQRRHVDILVNNAGISAVQRFVDTDPASWDRMWRVNLRAPMQLTHALLPAMQDRGWGRLIFIATDAAKVGAGGESVYGACKAGVVALGKTLARESARYGVTSNTVCPGLIDTPMLRKNMDEVSGVIEALTKTIPLRRPGTPEEVSGLVTYLASEQAAYVTGQAWSVSGGVTMT